MYAPFGAGVLIGPRSTFAEGDPFLAGGGAVDLVDLDEVVWTEPPDREEAGSPNVLGAVALDAAIDELARHRLARHRRPRPDDPNGAARRSGRDPRPSAVGPTGDDRHPGVGHLRRRGDPPRPGGGTAQRRVRDRRPPRLLLRPPLPAPPARPVAIGGHRLPRRPCWPGTAGRFPAPSGPAPASRRHPTTSTASSPPWRSSPQVTLRRSTTTKTPGPATTGRRPISRAGRPRIAASARPALAGRQPARGSCQRRG